MQDSYWAENMPEDWTDPGRGLSYNYYNACKFNAHGKLWNQTYTVIWEHQEGEDEPTFYFLARLLDCTFVTVAGWHDYTGLEHDA